MRMLGLAAALSWRGPSGAVRHRAGRKLSAAARIYLLSLIGLGLAACGTTRESRELGETTAAVETDAGLAHSAAEIADVSAPKWIYARGRYQGPGDIVLTAGDGAQQSVVASLSRYYALPDSVAVHRDSGAIVFADSPDAAGARLWLSHRGETPVALPGVQGAMETPSSISWPVISRDGTTVAYVLFGDRGWGEGGELRLFGLDDGSDRLLAGDLQTHVESPYVLLPVGWSSDDRQIFLDVTCDCGMGPHGFFVADLATGAVAQVAATGTNMSQIALAPTGTHIAYTAVDWSSDANPGPGAWPAELLVTDLASGESKTVADSPDGPFYGLTWSPDGARLAFGKGGDVFAYDLAAATTEQLASGDPALRPGLSPQLWLPGDRMVYTADTVGTPRSTALLVHDMGRDVWTEVDRAREIETLGWFQ